MKKKIYYSSSNLKFSRVEKIIEMSVLNFLVDGHCESPRTYHLAWVNIFWNRISSEIFLRYISYRLKSNQMRHFFMSRCLIMTVLGTFTLSLLTFLHPTEDGYVSLALSKLKNNHKVYSYVVFDNNTCQPWHKKD